MEIQLRLDENGRTTYDPTTTTVKYDDSTTTTTTKEKEQNNSDKKCNDNIDYGTKSLKTSFYDHSDDDDDKNNILNSILDDILLDCEIADVGILPRTFWISCDANPRCTLEKLALEIFHQHVPKSHKYDVTSSGAEWWVQIRPSPKKSGRYSMLVPENDNNEEEKNSIPFHWDKDEELRLLTKHTNLCYIHPHISTITYLTNYGAPTFIINDCIPNEYGLPTFSVNSNNNTNNNSSSSSAIVSYPKLGKHTSFDGRFLHGVVSDFTTHDTILPKENEDGKNNKKDIRKHRRITFLVNIWLNYKPLGVDVFPDCMIDNLSQHHTTTSTNAATNIIDSLLFHSKNDDNYEKKDDLLHNDANINSGSISSKNNTKFKTYSWEIGHNKEEDIECKLQMTLPNPLILHSNSNKKLDKSSSSSGNVKINWMNKNEINNQNEKDNCVCPTMSFVMKDVTTTKDNNNIKESVAAKKQKNSSLDVIDEKDEEEEEISNTNSNSG